MLRAQEGPADVDPEDTLPVLESDLIRRLGRTSDPCVVDEDVERAESIEHRAEHLLHASFVCDV